MELMGPTLQLGIWPGACGAGALRVELEALVIIEEHCWLHDLHTKSFVPHYHLLTASEPHHQPTGLAVP